METMAPDSGGEEVERPSRPCQADRGAKGRGGGGGVIDSGGFFDKEKLTISQHKQWTIDRISKRKTRRVRNQKR